MGRREFLKGSAAWAPGRVLGANDRIIIGQIGCGARGLYEVEVCQRTPGVEIAAVADVFEPVVAKTVEKLGGAAKGYTDFRRILDRKDIDAVFVSTPDHWHAIPTILACQAGKDVYCEKPLSHTIQEGRRMVEAARRYKRVVQTGSQQRSAPHFQKIVELIRKGHIGKVMFVECWNVGNEGPEGIGNPPDEDPPAGLDWDMYLGPARKAPYNRNRFVWNYRWFWDYSGGMMTDWGAHHMDVVQWAMGVEAPLSADATGGKLCLKDNRETPDTFTAVFEYPGFTATYSHRAVNARRLEGRVYGMLFHGTLGTLGTLVVDRSSYEVKTRTARPTVKARRTEDASNASPLRHTPLLVKGVRVPVPAASGCEEWPKQNGGKIPSNNLFGELCVMVGVRLVFGSEPGRDQSRPRSQFWDSVDRTGGRAALTFLLKPVPPRAYPAGVASGERAGTMGAVEQEQQWPGNQSDRDLALEAERGLHGLGAVVAMMGRLKDTIVKQERSTNRLNTLLLWFTIAIFGLTVGLTAVQVWVVFFPSHR